MNENLVKDLKCAIDDLKKEIAGKEMQLQELMEQYQELTGEEVEE